MSDVGSTGGIDSGRYVAPELVRLGKFSEVVKLNLIISSSDGVIVAPGQNGGRS